MSRKKSKINNFINTLFFLTGLLMGIVLIWPGILKNDNRKCFINIIEDGSDGKVTMGTILSVDPNSLLRINNAKNTYDKVSII